MHMLIEVILRMYTCVLLWNEVDVNVILFLMLLSFHSSWRREAADTEKKPLPGEERD